MAPEREAVAATLAETDNIVSQIPTMAAEREAVAAELAETDEMIKALEARKQSLVKAHARGDNLPAGCVLVWEKDLLEFRYRDERVGEHYGLYEQNTKWLNKCRNCGVCYKSYQKDIENMRKCGDRIQWTPVEKKFPCPACGAAMNKPTYGGL